MLGGLCCPHGTLLFAPSKSVRGASDDSRGSSSSSSSSRTCAGGVAGDGSSQSGSPGRGGDHGSCDWGAAWAEFLFAGCDDENAARGSGEILYAGDGRDVSAVGVVRCPGTAAATGTPTRPPPATIPGATAPAIAATAPPPAVGVVAASGVPSGCFGTTKGWAVKEEAMGDVAEDEGGAAVYRRWLSMIPAIATPAPAPAPAPAPPTDPGGWRNGDLEDNDRGVNSNGRVKNLLGGGIWGSIGGKGGDGDSRNSGNGGDGGNSGNGGSVCCSCGRLRGGAATRRSLRRADDLYRQSLYRQSKRASKRLAALGAASAAAQDGDDDDDGGGGGGSGDTGDDNGRAASCQIMNEGNGEDDDEESLLAAAVAIYGQCLHRGHWRRREVRGTTEQHLTCLHTNTPSGVSPSSYEPRRAWALLSHVS